MDDPVTSPMTYPGKMPGYPAVLVLGDSAPEIRVSAGPVKYWQVNGEPLDGFLRNVGAPPVSERHAVLAVGSNACPAQVRRKMLGAGISPAIPVMAVRARNLIAGMSAHVSKAGYIPATPVPVPSTSSLFVTWLSDGELAAMDATEPNYRRVELSASYPVRLPDGQLIRQCWAYASRHGYLTGESGQPYALTSQEALITALLAQVPALAVISPLDEWAARMQDPQARDQVRKALQAADIVRNDAPWIKESEVS
jgi:hypothetical protein